MVKMEDVKMGKIETVLQLPKKVKMDKSETVLQLPKKVKMDRI